MASIVYDKSAFERAHARMRLAPIELTEADLEQLATVDPALGTKGREAHRHAQLAIVQQHTPALQTKAANTDDRSRRPVQQKHLQLFADQVGTLLAELLAKNVLPLREQVTALSARVLELEAQAAARTVEHAER